MAKRQGSILRKLLLLLTIVVVGAAIYLGTVDIPPPTQKTVVTLDNALFYKDAFKN